MDRRDFLKQSSKAAAGGAFMLMGGCQGTPASGEKSGRKPPNLVFVFSDQQRRRAMGFMNQDPVRTPHFDHFAEESCVMTNAISAFPLCAPYRAMTFSGRHPFSNGVTWNGGSLREEVTTIFDVLQNNGYQTGYVGKWHLGGLYKKPWVAGDNRYYKWRYDVSQRQNYWMREWTPRKYRPYFDYWHGNECFNDMFRLNYFEEDPDKPVLGRRWQPDHETDVAIDFIKKQQAADNPFALFLSWNPPHPGNRFLNKEQMDAPDEDMPWPKPKIADSGYYAPDHYKKMYSDLTSTGCSSFKPTAGKEDIIEHMPGYFGAVTSLDACFGRLMECLKQQSLDRDTIVVFTSDHGDMMGSHGKLGKRLWHEESIGVPFMIRWPGKIKQKKEEMVFSNLHIMPTLLGLMGLPIPAAVEGTDYSKVLTDRSPGKSPTELIEYVCAFRRKRPEDHHFIEHEAKSYVRSHGEWRGLRSHRHSYVVQLLQGKFTRYLYDLVEDPYQMRPLTSVDEVLYDMKELDLQLREKLAEAHDPFLKWLTGSKAIPPCLS